MGKAAIDEEVLDGIGRAIIAKGGATAPMKPSEMPAAIAAIPSGGETLDFFKRVIARNMNAVEVCNDYVGEIGRIAFGDEPNLVSLTMDGATSLANGVFYQATNNKLATLSFRSVTYAGQYPFWTCDNLESIDLHSLSSLHSETFRMQNALKLADVYIRGKTANEIIGIPNFPGMTLSNNARYASVVFHGSDADVKYIDGSWTVVEV